MTRIVERLVHERVEMFLADPNSGETVRQADFVAKAPRSLAASLGMDITIAHPLGFELDEEVTDTAHDRAEGSGGRIRVTNSLEEAATDADVLYARSWGSAKCWGDPDRESIIKRSLESWRIDSSVMARTRDAMFMHPLPVRRNVVATDNVVDGPRSMIYDQAENRVHVQKALLLQLLS